MLIWLLLIAVPGAHFGISGADVAYFPQIMDGRPVIYRSAEDCRQAAQRSTFGYQGVDEVLQPSRLSKSGWQMPMTSPYGVLQIQSRCEGVSPPLSQADLALLKSHLTEMGWASLEPVFEGDYTPVHEGEMTSALLVPAVTAGTKP